MYPISDIAESRALGRPVRMTFPRLLAWISDARRADIKAACDIASAHLSAPLREPGGSTMAVRMAARLGDGMTVETAAAREYAYRWMLSVGQWANHAEARSRSRPVTGAFPAPHCIGL